MQSGKNITTPYCSNTELHQTDKKKHIRLGIVPSIMLMFGVRMVSIVS